MIVVMALVLVVLLSMMALTLEGGGLMVQRRRVQAAADAAAMAAACDLTYQYGFNGGLDPQNTAKSSALNSINLNYPKDTDRANLTATVTIPPPPSTPQIASNFVGRSGYAQVDVVFNQPRGFSGIFGSGPLQVRASAVARGRWDTYPIAFLALEPTLPASLVVGANASVAVKNGDADINSTSSLSTTLALNSQFSVPSPRVVNISGNYLAALNGTIAATVKTGVDPTPDPLKYLSPPDASTLPTRSVLLRVVTGNETLQPGVYLGGIKIAAIGTVTLAPGIYYMAGGGFEVVAGNLRGDGVMIVNAPVLTTDDILIAGTATVDLKPPTSGLYSGITIMQPAALIPLPLGLGPPLTIGANSLPASSLFSIQGTVYAPQSNVFLAGNGSANVASQLICRTASVAANASVQINWTKNTSRTPYPVKLVE